MPLRAFPALLAALILATSPLAALDVEILLDPATRTPTNGQEATWLVVFDEPVQVATVAATDFAVDTVGGAFGTVELTLAEITATSFRARATWSSAAAEGTVGLRTAAGFAVTTAANAVVAGVPASGPEVTVDNTGPDLVFINTTGNASTSDLGSLVFQVVFNEAIDPATVTASDFAVDFSATSAVTVAPGFFTVAAPEAIASGVFTVRVTGQAAAVDGLTGTLRLITAGGFAVADLAGNVGNDAFSAGQAFAVVRSAGDNNLTVPALVGPRPAEVAVGSDIVFELTVLNPVAQQGGVGGFAPFTFVPAAPGAASLTPIAAGDGARVNIRIDDVPAQAGGYLDFAIDHGGTRVPVLIKVTAAPAGSN